MRRHPPHPDQALARALQTLQHAAGAGFPEAVHAMRFPAWLAGGAQPQVARAFPQAVLALALLDIADRLDDPQPWRAWAAGIADAVAAERLTALHGGWRYFPGLAPLPPDLDSLAAAMALFARAAPQHLPRCDGPARLALDGADATGACPTWLIHPQDPLPQRLALRAGVRWLWGGTRDADVNARFAAALIEAGRPADAETPARHVRAQQQADGLWPRTWYACPLQTAALALAVPGVDAAGAHRAIAARQRPDGAWASEDRPEGDVQSTAFATWLLASHDPAAARRGAAWLCAMQDDPGAWRATPWLRMEVGRARGRVRQVARWGSATLNTAWAVRALLAVR